jgi:hypothetical protein
LLKKCNIDKMSVFGSEPRFDLGPYMRRLNIFNSQPLFTDRPGTTRTTSTTSTSGTTRTTGTTGITAAAVAAAPRPVATVATAATNITAATTAAAAAVTSATSSLISSVSTPSSIGTILAYIIGIIIIAIIIILLIHHYITPVYNLHPGAPGIITIPGFDDGILFWNGGSGKYPGVSDIKNEDLPIKNMYYDYSLNVDMFIQNPLQFSNNPRILLSRGLVRSATPSGDAITGIADNYNLIVALHPNTTDMIVSMLSSINQAQNIIIENILVQEPFRLGIIVMQNALEVYINGNLMQTTSFKNSLKDVKGDIAPAAGIESNIAKMQNLKIWNRVLSSSEMRHATPALPSVASFGAGAIPSSTSCLTSQSASNQFMSAISNASNMASRASSRASSSISNIKSGI